MLPKLKFRKFSYREDHEPARIPTENFGNLITGSLSRSSNQNFRNFTTATFLKGTKFRKFQQWEEIAPGTKISENLISRERHARGDGKLFLDIIEINNTRLYDIQYFGRKRFAHDHDHRIRIFDLRPAPERYGYYYHRARGKEPYRTVREAILAVEDTGRSVAVFIPGFCSLSQS